MSATEQIKYNLDYATEKLRAKTLAQNEIADYFNTVIPMIKDYLSENIKLKKDGSLCKRNYDYVMHILNTNKPPHELDDNYIHNTSWIDHTIHSGLLKVSANIKFKYYSPYDKCIAKNQVTFDDYIYLWSNKVEWVGGCQVVLDTELCKSLTEYIHRFSSDFNDVLKAKKKMKKLDKMIDDLNKKKQDIKSEFYKILNQ